MIVITKQVNNLFWVPKVNKGNPRYKIVRVEK